MKSQSNATSHGPISQIQFNASDVQMMWESCRHFYALAPIASPAASQSSSSINDLPPLLEDALSDQNTAFNDQQRAPDMPKVCVCPPLSSFGVRLHHLVRFWPPFFFFVRLFNSVVPNQPCLESWQYANVFMWMYWLVTPGACCVE